jgi:hypothetical protein
MGQERDAVPIGAEAVVIRQRQLDKVGIEDNYNR